VFPIEMPPLRAHIEDVREIVEHLLARIAGAPRRLEAQAVEAAGVVRLAGERARAPERDGNAP